MIGAATPGGWDNDSPFVYDDATKTLVIESIDLTATEFKFRANNDWALNIGLDPATGEFKYGSDTNFKVTTAGKYKVVLDLSKSPNYTYKLIKL